MLAEQIKKGHGYNGHMISWRATSDAVVKGDTATIQVITDVGAEINICHPRRRVLVGVLSSPGPMKHRQE